MMRHLLLSAVIAASAVCMPAAAVRADTGLVVNGDFGQFVPSSGVGGGWVASGIDFNGGWKNTGGNPGPFYAINGGVEATPVPLLEQYVEGLTVGTTYRVSGDRKINLLIQNGTEGSFEVRLDGSPITTLDQPGPQGQWFVFEATFTATSSTHRIGFAAETNGTDTDYGIDNISVTPVDEPDGGFAWGANSGWIDFGTTAAAGQNPRVVFGRAFLLGYAWSGNFGWIDLGDGSPANGHRYGNDTVDDYGVNHDGAGNLSGYAWSPNVGWIHFGWSWTDDPNRPRVDLQTGAFFGYAWSPAMGWMNLGTSFLNAERMERPDSDGDGVEDAFEFRHFGDLDTADADSDQDHDGATDREESIAATDPLDPASNLRIIDYAYQPEASAVSLEFLHEPGLLYRVQSRPTLSGTSSWTSLGTAPFAPDTGTSTSVDAPTSSEIDADFFRILAIPPLQEDTPGP